MLCFVTPSCPTLCDPIDRSPPGSSIHGILQARTLEWVAMPSSRESSQFRNRTQVSRTAGGFFTIRAKNMGVGSLSSLQGSSQPRNRHVVSCIAGRFFTSWATRGSHVVSTSIYNSCWRAGLWQEVGIVKKSSLLFAMFWIALILILLTLLWSFISFLISPWFSAGIIASLCQALYYRKSLFSLQLPEDFFSACFSLIVF